MAARSLQVLHMHRQTNKHRRQHCMELVHVMLYSACALRESVYIPISRQINCAYIDSPIKRLVKLTSEMSDGFRYRLQAVKHQLPPMLVRITQAFKLPSASMA